MLVTSYNFTGKGGSSSSNRKHSAVEHNRPANSRDSQERSEINGKVSKGLNILSYIRAGQELLVDNGYIKATGSAITLYSMYHANRRFNNGEIEKVKRDIAIKDGIPSLFFPQLRYQLWWEVTQALSTLMKLTSL